MVGTERWVNCSVHGSVYEEEIDAASFPARYRHRLRGHNIPRGLNHRLQDALKMPPTGYIEPEWKDGPAPDHRVTRADIATARIDKARNAPTALPTAAEIKGGPPSLIERLRRDGEWLMNHPERSDRTASAGETMIEGADEIEGWSKSFDLYWKANQRAIKAWQAAHPGNDLVWPDTAKMVEWLMERHAAMLDKLATAKRRLTELGANTEWMDN